MKIYNLLSRFEMSSYSCFLQNKEVDIYSWWYICYSGYYGCVLLWLWSNCYQSDWNSTCFHHGCVLLLIKLTRPITEKGALLLAKSVLRRWVALPAHFLAAIWHMARTLCSLAALYEALKHWSSIMFNAHRHWPHATYALTPQHSLCYVLVVTK